MCGIKRKIFRLNENIKWIYTESINLIEMDLVNAVSMFLKCKKTKANSNFSI